MSENKLCMGCMEYKGTSRVCPKCGYVENTPYLPAYKLYFMKDIS
mgnify:CR=1 FL=1